MLKKNSGLKLRLKHYLVIIFTAEVIGNYIVDFCAPAVKLVIEVDGSQHYTNEGIVADKTRDGFYKAAGSKY